MPYLHTNDFRPGDPNATSGEMFEQWLEQATPERLERFGRTWFPRLWSCWARIRLGQKPPLQPCGQGRGLEPLEAPWDWPP
jgi:hypothetical protein